MPNMTGITYVDMNKMFLEKLDKDLPKVTEVCRIYVDDRVKMHSKDAKLSKLAITVSDEAFSIAFDLEKNGKAQPFSMDWTKDFLAKSDDPITALIETRVKEALTQARE